MTSREIAYTSLYLSVTIALHLALAPIPNISATFILLILYVKNNRFYKSFMFLSSFVLIINLIYGFSLFTIIQLFSYYILLLYNKYNIKRVILVSVLMMWIYIPFNVFVYDIDLYVYFMADIPFTMIFTINNVLCFIWLYDILDERIMKLWFGKQ